MDSSSKYVIFFPSLESSLYQERVVDYNTLQSSLQEIASVLSEHPVCYYQPYLWVYGKRCYRFSVFERELEYIEYSDFLPILRRRINNENISYDPRRDNRFP